MATVEAARSLEAAANELRRDDITLPSAMRWVRRRLAPVRDLLTIMVGLFPQLLLGCAPTIKMPDDILNIDDIIIDIDD